mmetsp:Transcript_17793/g.27683  ORF Transcript_17793/g.27683 Transcript_17793/m.27683 type:complete len:145 (-) Transcript_17793:320-754(-)|eukprot:CAMPEP_0196814292 /NCGR_PEP_ID=MMETSP1362-20130617/42484_1 /TAXON_ID=163516 /ORGANISM="Leptocylindrus danicus, Strain CCMP1856" /LENGTH=144 /DNA_ID=CAMNT_0042190859 /DNA_START=106 /DNA_END=540 /DNA_ORIENTATION=+
MSVNEVKMSQGAPKMEVKGDNSNKHNRTFCISQEDHTIGNSIRHVLMQNQKVNFAGYSVPHPSDSVVHIRVQTTDQHRALDVMIEAGETLSRTCDYLLEQVEAIIPDVAEDSIRIEKIYRAMEEEEDESVVDEDEEMGEEEEEY